MSRTNFSVDIYISLLAACCRFIMVKRILLILLFFGMITENFSKSKSTEYFSQLDAKVNPGNDAYLWTAFFNEKSNSYLIDLLTKWNIKTLFLSVNPTMDLAKLKAFQNLASEKGIKIDFLIGENSYAEEEDGFIHLEKVMMTGKELGFEGIHLDIEPHTFDDYGDNIKTYSKIQSKLFENAKKWCDDHGMDLSVSVPMYLPIKVAKTLGRYNITTHIMAYGNSSVDYKLEQTQAMRKVLKTNDRWAFEIDDFTDYKSLKETESTLIEKGITKFTYHDLAQMDAFKK